MASLLASVLLFGPSLAAVSGLRRLLAAKDYCNPLDYPIPAIAHCGSCPSCATQGPGCIGTCDVCKQGYYTTGPSCAPCLADCRVCTDASSCDVCDPGMFFFETPSAACEGSIQECGSGPPLPFQPAIAGGLSLVQGATRLVISAEMSNYFYDVNMSYVGCGSTTQTGPTRGGDGTSKCNGVYMAEVDYRNDCSFSLKESTENGAAIYVFSGVLKISVSYPVYFLGELMAEPGFLSRPVLWKLKLNKLLTSEVSMTVRNNNQCPEADVASATCNGNACVTSSTPDPVDGAYYLVCICDACHAGPLCEQDICAPTPTCPAGTLTVQLGQGKTRADGKLSMLSSSVAFLPSAVDNVESGWSRVTPANIRITRQIGGGNETVVQQNGFNSDDLLTMVWGTPTYALQTSYTVSYKFYDTLNGPVSSCSFTVQVKDVGAPTITCPTDKVTNSMPQWSLALDASASDNIDPSPVISQVGGERSSNCTPNSRQNITLRATDASGNYAECKFSVTYDTTPPVVTCPPDYAVNGNVDSSGNYQLTSWAAVEAQISFSDALSGLVAGNVFGTPAGDPVNTVYSQRSNSTSYYVYQPGGGQNMGNGGRTYTRFDQAGNSASCIARVRVTDVTPPVVTCPSTRNYVADAKKNYHADPAFPALFTASDNVGVVWTSTVSSNFSITSGTRKNQPYNVTFSARDPGGLTANCSVVVYVVDAEDPNITCPASGPVSADALKTYYTVPVNPPWGNVVAQDNDGIASIVNNASALIYQTTAITYTATDLSGRSKNCSFTVTPVDTTPPTLTCPNTVKADLVRFTDPGKNYWTVNLVSSGLVAYSDNLAIDPASVLTNYADGRQLNWTLVSNGNSGNGNSGNGNSDNGNSGNGNSASSSKEVVTTITYSVADYAGNVATCSFTVVVKDAEPPTFVCKNQTTSSAPGAKYIISDGFLLTVKDNADTTVNGLDVTYMPRGARFSSNPKIGNLMTATVSDASGNTAVCKFYVFVSQACQSGYGAKRRGLGCRKAITGRGKFPLELAQVVGGGSFYVTVPTAQSAWNSAVTVGVDEEVDLDELSAAITSEKNEKKKDRRRQLAQLAGTLGSVWTYMDADFAIISSILDVDFDENGTQVVNASAGHYITMELCPTDTMTRRAYLYLSNDTYGIDSDVHCASIGPGVPTRTYNSGTGCWSFSVCGSGLVVMGLTSADALNWLTCNDVSSVYATTTSGYTVSVSFNAVARTTLTNLALPSGAYRRVDTSYGPATGITSPYRFPPGTHSVYIKATNGSFIGGVCTFKVIVRDGVKPILDGCNATAKTLSMDYGSDMAIYTVPTVYGVDETSFSSTDIYYLTNDTTPSPVVPTYTLASGGNYTGGVTAILAQGVSTFTWTVFDGAGNVGTCISTITVVDKESPVLVCPAEIIINASSGMSTGYVASTTVTVYDNVDPDRTATVALGTYAIGRRNITYTGTDAAGNSNVCVFYVTVNDNQPPALTCPTAVSITTTASTESVTRLNTSVIYTDNDLAHTAFYVSPTSASVSATTPVTVTIKDQGVYPYAEGNRNSISCVINVTTLDIAPPVLTCPSNQQVSASTATASPNWPAVTITDNDIVSPTVLGSNYASGDAFPVRNDSASSPNTAPSVTTVTYTGRDASGNTASCSFTVTVLDTGAPYFTGAAIRGVTPLCPSNKSYNSNDYSATPVAGWWEQPVAVDYKGVTNNISSQQDPFRALTNFSLGANQITYTALDAAGNQGICRFTVTVADTRPPVITSCPSDVRINTSAGLATATYSFHLNATDDFTSWASLQWSSGSGHTLPAANKSVTQTGLAVGNNTIKYIARDGSGNPSSECVFTVLVVDAEAPVLTCPTAVVGNIGSRVVPTNPSYNYHIRLVNGTSVAVNWPEAAATDNNGQAGLAVTYSPTQGTVFSKDVAQTTVTATATDAAGNTASCQFYVKVWDAYPSFSTSQARAAVNRMIIAAAASAGSFEATVQYVTQVPWPYLLKAPTSLPAGVSNYGEELTKRSCVRLVDGAGSALGVYKSVTTYCYQFWNMKVAIPDCNTVAIALTLGHTADCWPGDCGYGDTSVSIDLNVNAGNLCENDLGTVQASASLFVLSQTTYNSWLSTYQSQGSANTADPTSSLALDSNAEIHCLVRVASDQVLFQSATIQDAVRREYSSAARTGPPTSEETLVANGAVVAGSTFNVNPSFVTGQDYAMFKYTEDIPLQSEAYQKLTVTVLVTYQLGGTRRQLVRYEVDQGAARRQRQLLQSETTGLEAEASLSLKPFVGGGRGDVPVATANITPPTSETWPHTAGGIAALTIISLLLCAGWLFLACCAYKQGISMGIVKHHANEVDESMGRSNQSKGEVADSNQSKGKVADFLLENRSVGSSGYGKRPPSLNPKDTDEEVSNESKVLKVHDSPNVNSRMMESKPLKVHESPNVNSRSLASKPIKVHESPNVNSRRIGNDEPSQTPPSSKRVAVHLSPRHHLEDVNENKSTSFSMVPSDGAAANGSTPHGRSRSGSAGEVNRDGSSPYQMPRSGSAGALSREAPDGPSRHRSASGEMRDGTTPSQERRALADGTASVSSSPSQERRELGTDPSEEPRQLGDRLTSPKY